MIIIIIIILIIGFNSSIPNTKYQIPNTKYQIPIITIIDNRI